MSLSLHHHYFTKFALSKLMKDETAWKDYQHVIQGSEQKFWDLFWYNFC